MILEIHSCITSAWGRTLHIAVEILLPGSELQKSAVTHSLFDSAIILGSSLQLLAAKNLGITMRNKYNGISSPCYCYLLEQIIDLLIYTAEMIIV